MIGSVLALAKAELLQNSLSATASVESSRELDELQRVPRSELLEAKTERSLTCQVCQIGVSSHNTGFTDVTEQREHFKTDWHRLNVHRALSQRSCVTREQFEQLLDNEDVSSISGSDSEAEESARAADPASSQKHGMVCFTLENGKSFRVWKCLVASEKVMSMDGDTLHEALMRLAHFHKWAVILAKGGHFAAACFQRSTPSHNKSKGSFYTITHHKTFHRYVVRAKAGGRQSTKDASGKYAHSAGASIRRHNEAALEKEIAEVLRSWKAELDVCDVIFTAISQSDIRAVFGGEAPVLQQQDPRVRRIPFPTRRPTFSEAKRVTHLLTAMYKPPTILEDTLEAPPAHIPASEPTEDPQDEPEAAPEPHAPRTKASKKKRRKPKGKDQRRQAAMVEKDTSEEPPPERVDDDEVERAIAEAERLVQSLEMNKKASGTRKSAASQPAPENPVERREVLRQAAEKRMAALQAASKNQQLR